MDGITKLKTGQTLSLREKQLLVNVLNYNLNNRAEDESVNYITKKVSEMTGVSQRTLFTVRKASTSATGIEPPKKRAKGERISNSRSNKYDEATQGIIRTKVHSFFLQNIPPTLNAILASVNADPDVPDFSKTTLYRLLKDMGFMYHNRTRRAMLIEKPEIIEWRHRYLRAIRNYRRENFNIVYLDESWVNIGHTVNKEWTDTTVESHRDAFVRGLSTGLKAPTSRGPRFVLVHAGSKNGFVAGAELTFLAKKNSQDYHDEMDGETFEQWFENDLIPNIPQKTVIVMDNASYHSRKLEKVPNASSNKKTIKEWLLSKDIYFEEDYLKRELLEVVNKYKNQFNGYIIEEIAKKHDVKILRLPPYHCELNPIEMAWNQVKGYVARKNATFKEADVRNLIKDAYENVTPENWTNYVNHTQKTEEKMWKVDNLMDDVQPLIININSGDSDTEIESDSDFE